MLKKFVVGYHLSAGNERHWSLFQPENRHSILPRTNRPNAYARVVWSVTPTADGGADVEAYEIFPNTSEGLHDLIDAS